MERSDHLNSDCAEFFCINHGEQRVFLNLKSSEMSQLALSDYFEYLCYGSTALERFYSYSAGIDFGR